MRRPSLFLLGATALGLGLTLAFGCVGDDPALVVTPTPDAGGAETSTTSDGGAGDGGETAPLLSTSPAKVRIVQGTSASVVVNVDRRGLAGALPVTVIGLPSGVAASEATIPAGESKVTLTLTATAQAKTGPVPITLKAPGTADLAVPLVVAGLAGTLDENFNQGGLRIETTKASAVFYGVAVQTDGKVVAVGTTTPLAPATSKWLVMRFDEKGAPDTAFNAAADLATPAIGTARAVGIDGVGRLVVVGASSATDRLTIVRLNADGSASQSFGNGGVVLADNVTFQSPSRAMALALLPTGDILVAGGNGSPERARVDRFTSGGQQAPTNVFQSYAETDASLFTGIAVLPSGAILATGTDVNASPDAQLAVRLNANGTLDTTFGGGRRTYASGCRGFGLALSDGDALIVGNDQVSPSLCATRIAASDTGNLIWTVATNGGAGPAQFSGAVASTAGGTIAAGWGGGSQDRFALVERRFTDGGLDPSFATAGTFTSEDPATPDLFNDQYYGLSSTPDGQVVVVGQRVKSSTGPLVARLWQ